MSARLDPSMSPGPACGKCDGEKRHTGTRWRCPICYRAKVAEWVASRSPEKREADRVRANDLRNAGRAQWSPERRAHANAQTAAWREANRERHRQMARDWYAANSEHVKARQSAAYRADPAKFIARVKKREAQLEAAVCEHGLGCVNNDVLAALYADRCLYCDNPAEHADHFVPLAAGGLHCRDNIVPACPPCNLSKHASDPWEWIARLTA